MKKTIKEYSIITVGIFLLAMGVYFFKFPNNFSTGGVSGIAVILSPFMNNISSSDVMTVLNIVFLTLGFIFLKKDCGLKSIYGTVMLSVFVSMFEHVYPLTGTLTDQKLLELVFSIVFPSIGAAIVFLNGASSGGTDIIAMILRKFTNLDIGTAIFITDIIFCTSTIFIFGIETFMFSTLGLLSKSFIVDIVIESISTKKIVSVVTAEPKLVTNFITNELHRGVTNWECIGGYTGEHRTMIMSAMSKKQALNLSNYAKSVDNKSFIIVNRSSEVFGKGFGRTF